MLARINPKFNPDVSAMVCTAFGFDKYPNKGIWAAVMRGNDSIQRPMTAVARTGVNLSCPSAAILL